MDLETKKEAAQNVASFLHKELWEGDVLSGVSCGMQSTVLCDVISATDWQNLLDLWERYDDADKFKALKHLVTGAVDVPAIAYDAMMGPLEAAEPAPYFTIQQELRGVHFAYRTAMRRIKELEKSAEATTAPALRDTTSNIL